MVAVASADQRIVGVDSDGQAWMLVWGDKDWLPAGWQRLPMVEVAVEDGELLDEAAIAARREAGL